MPGGATHAGARDALGRAIALAARHGDHWVTFECTARLALLELESGNVEAAERLCPDLVPLASKLGEGSEQPYATAIDALGAIARSDPNGDALLDGAVADLDRIDARFLVPDLLGIAAEIHHRAERLDLANDRARRAQEVAEEVSRPCEAARAHALLACIAAQQGDLGRSLGHLQSIDAGAQSVPGHVERLQQEAHRLLEAAQAEQGGEQWQ